MKYGIGHGSWYDLVNFSGIMTTIIFTINQSIPGKGKPVVGNAVIIPINTYLGGRKNWRTWEVCMDGNGCFMLFQIVLRYCQGTCI